MGLIDATDAELVTRLRSGQQQALAILYDRYAGLVYSLAFKVLQNQQEAEDLTQDIFLTFWKQDRFDPTRGRLSSFLGLLTRSRAIDKIRKSNTSQKFLDKWQKIVSEDSSSDPLLEKASQEEQREKLQSALQELPEIQRKILQMNYFEGLSQAKIAEALNLTLGTVKSRSRQGLIQLKKFLLENQ